VGLVFDFESVLNGIGVLLGCSFNGERWAELRNDSDIGVAGDCDDGISRGRIRRGVCGGGIVLLDKGFC